MLNGKIWGNSLNIISNNCLELHRIEFKKSFKCSEHKHEHKWNGFYVEKGKLLIRVWQEGQNLVDETILNQGQYTQIMPGVYHQFEGIEDGVAFELYWPELPKEDIVRRTVGCKVKEN